ncbi:MAG: phenylalanine--tRNA ligase subunit beta [Candidatus Paceibacterota bacterium]
MLVSYDWIQDFIQEPLPPADEIARELTMRAFEVEGIEKVGKKYPGVIVGHVVRIEEHPNADRLRLIIVDLGDSEEHRIVCGASNFSEGALVPVATIGTVLPNGMEIKVATIRDVESRGMICSKAELGLEKESDGIWVLDSDAAPGTLFDEVVEGGEVETVFDIDVLPNRAHDCLSHRGIAREIAVLFGLTFTDYESDLEFSEREPSEKPETLSVLIDEPERCRRYVGVHLDGLVCKESPAWLQDRLRSIGLRPKNAVVDAANYIMFSTGQPLHAFDAAKLGQTSGSHMIQVRAGRKEESMRALDGKKYDLPEESTVIADASADGIALALGGVIGGEDSAVSDKTTEVILEAANFDPVLTRKTSQALKLATDSSKRFENEISPVLAPMAMNALIVLLKDIAGTDNTAVRSVVDRYPDPVQQQSVSVTADKVNRLLGTEVTEKDIVDVLTRLSFQVEKGNDALSVTPPLDRLDVTTVPDVIEEVGRIYGYETITEVAPPSRDGDVPIHERFYWLNVIRDELVKVGFSEVMTYALRKKGELEIENPLAEDKAFVRNTLVDGVAQALEHNERYTDLLGISEVALFEIGNVYRDEEERTMLSLAASPTKRSAYKTQEILDRARVALTDTLGVEVVLPKDVPVVEINIDKILEKLPAPGTYDNLTDLSGDITYLSSSVYPYMLRDVALWVPKSVSKSDVEKVLLEETGKLLVNHYLFDEYEPVEGGEKSYAFRFVFQSFEKTLSDEEVNVIMDSVYKALDAKKGWKTR